MEDVGGVRLDPVGGGEDGVVDAEVAPELGVERAELGDPNFPVARGAEPAAEVEAVLGGGDGLGWGRGAEGGRQGRGRGTVERGQEMGKAALIGPVHVDGELVDEEDHIAVIIGGGDGCAIFPMGGERATRGRRRGPNDGGDPRAAERPRRRCGLRGERGERRAGVLFFLANR